VRLTRFDLDIIKNFKAFEEFDKSLLRLPEALAYIKFLMEQIKLKNESGYKKELFILIQDLKATRNLIDYNYNLILRYLRNTYSNSFPYIAKRSNLLSSLNGIIKTIEEILNDYQRNYLRYS
jgi:hypothetical protein